MDNNNSKPLTVQQVRFWLESPVTLEFVKKLKLSKHNTLEGMSNEVLGAADEKMLDRDFMGKLIGYKAQVQVIEMILDLENFIREETEEEPDEIQSTEL